MNVLLIGGSKGIGRSLAVDLANLGNTVYVLSRTQVEDYPGIVQIEFDVKSGVWPSDRLPEVLHGFAYLPGSIRLKPFHRLTEEDLLERNITFYSYCEHHFVPIIGKAHVAYVPEKYVIGLSKLNRIVQYFSRRPQVQERLTEQIAESLKKHIGKYQSSMCFLSSTFTPVMS